MNPPKQKRNGNGSISGETKVRLSLGIPLVALAISAATWVARVENHIANDDRDPFRGSDMDRLSGRIQWAWENYASQAGLDCYPALPPWRAGTHFQPSIIRLPDDE